MDKSQAMSGVELRECPFCGGEATILKSDLRPCNLEGWEDGYNVWCLESVRCSGRLPGFHKTRDEAIAAWNTRAMPDERALIVAWLREDAKQCDCFARGEGECTCGAWWDNKESNVLNLADAIEAGDHLK